MHKLDSPTESIADKRQYERVSSDAAISIRNSSRFTTAMRSSSALDTPCNLADLSFGGAKLVGSAPLGQPDDRLEIVIPLSDGSQLTLIGTVVRSDWKDDNYAAGVRFVRISVEDEIKLSDVLVSLGDDTLDSFKGTPLVPTRKHMHMRRGATLLH
ncbi:MAG: PilZ domain-containing protein [Gammaproteobacteria bacterium]|nr:PilZ domain-containing protein [Gammaproteobacteria bacterium]MDH3467372.1 PilZ domain-containing protein [Gammaproteobacteria bacterium]